MTYNSNNLSLLSVMAVVVQSRYEGDSKELTTHSRIRCVTTKITRSQPAFKTKPLSLQNTSHIQIIATPGENREVPFNQPVTPYHGPISLLSASFLPNATSSLTHNDIFSDPEDLCLVSPLLSTTPATRAYVAPLLLFGSRV